MNRLLADVNTEQVQQPAHFWVLDLAVAMAAAGRGVEFVERLPTLGPPTRWAEAAELWARDAFERAADLLEEIGARPDEALARLRAAETLSSAARWGSSARSARLATSVRARGCSPHPHDARLPFLWAREP